VDVGLHHHRPQGPIDAATALEDRREEAPLAQLGHAQLDVSGLGREQSRPGPVALVAAGLGQLGLDEGLEDELQASTNHVEVAAGANGVQEIANV
jgi:hypothetical protein